MKKNYNILVVDYDKNILEEIKKNFELEGFMVDICNNSLEALKKFEMNKYHIVVTEIDMEMMNGIELLKKIKEIDPLTEVIIMTEHSSMERIFKCLEAGASDYVLKPFKSLDYLHEVVNYSIKKLERWKEAIRDIVK